MKPQRSLSTLEYTILGLSWLRGPRRIYAIMKDLSLSASSYHKQRAGAAYSASKRLVGFGLLSQEQPDGDVAITDDGMDALRKWLSPPAPMADVAHSMDLLRLRLFFLGAMTAEDRIRFLDESLVQLQELLDLCRKQVRTSEEMGEFYGALAGASFVLETKARIAWVRLAREMVEQPMPENWADELLARIDRGEEVRPTPPE